MSSSGSTPPPPDRPRRPRLIAGVLATTLASGALFLLIEGAASVAVFLNAIRQDRQPVRTTEQSHAEFDPEIGWVSRPGVRVPNLYGPGVSLTTDERGFRGSGPVSPTLPAGTDRVLCSGDSFTLGYGVGDDQTWCALLERPDEGWTAANLGQGGYGLDQVYLWYRRAARDLERTVHIVAFIGEDFRRMRTTDFLGFGKPRLGLRDGALVVEGTPVPRRGIVGRWLLVNGHLFTRLRTVQVLQSLVADPEVAERGGTSIDETWDVAAAVFDELARENAERGARLLLVFLPAPWDYEQDFYGEWRERVAAYASRGGTPYVDLVAALRDLPPDVVDGFFFPPTHPGADHLTEVGNRWVAGQLAPLLDSLRRDDPGAGG